jgi:hypothetical protein
MTKKKKKKEELQKYEGVCVRKAEEVCSMKRRNVLDIENDDEELTGVLSLR